MLYNAEFDSLFDEVSPVRVPYYIRNSLCVRGVATIVFNTSHNTGTQAI